MEKTGVNRTLFQTFYQKTPMPLLVLDKENMIIYRNELMEDWIDQSNNMLIGVIHNEDRRNFWKNVQRVVNLKSSSVSFEMSWVRKQKKIPVQLHANLLEMDGESFVVLTIQDLAGLAVERSMMEEKLVKEQKRRFRVLINLLPDIIVFKDRDGSWLEVNDAAIECFPWLKEGSYKGKSNKELMEMYSCQGDYFTNSLQTDLLAWGTGKAVHTEYSFEIPNREPITLDLMTVPIYDVSGIREGLLLVGRDITARKKAELRLEESEQKYKSLFEHSPSGIYSLDLKGNITSFNDSMNQMFGYTKNDLLQSIVPFIATDYLKKTRRLFMKAVKGEIQKYETAGINKNGDRVYVKVTHLPIKVQGEIVGVYGVAKDITKQKEKEEELRRTKELLESLFQHSADCIAIISLDGIIQDVNSACSNMYGWEPDELKGKFFQVIPEDRMEELQTVFKNIKRGQEVVGLETIRMKKDGSLFDVSVTFSPLKDAEGNIIGLTAISRDISERKRTEELLSRSDKLSAIGQLAASVAHEIRNPLTSIKGFIQLFQGNIREQFVELMLSELARIEMIVTEFMLLAKPQSINFGEKDVTSIIFHTLAIMESQALMNKVEVIPILAADIPDIRCDENKIKQVLINVLKNALEAMPKGGKVHIYTEQQHEEILIRITDDGYGIPKERIKKLGEPFYSNKEKGTGLGLMVCYKIIEEHQGRIIIESEEGMGTSVNIYLPVHVEE